MRESSERGSVISSGALSAEIRKTQNAERPAYRRRFGTFLIFVAWVFAVCGVASGANFSTDEYVSEPQVLARIVSAAQGFGDPLRSRRFEHGRFAYYLRSAEYVGSCDAPFGTVHIGYLFFIRSSARGSAYPPARGQSFVVFLDGDFVIHALWRVDFFGGHLSVNGSKLLFDGDLLFDYTNPPRSELVAVDGNVQGVPIWTRTKKKTHPR